MPIVDEDGMVRFSSEEPTEAELKAYNRERAERIVEKAVDDLDDLLAEIKTAHEHDPSIWLVQAGARVYDAMEALGMWQSDIPYTD